MAGKSRDAFRTISEVADWLDVPTHVLRFWESRFSQIKPVKRAGGRRYYRPSDMRIIGGVKVLLHDQGMTIRGVQKLFREEGLKHVSGFSPRLFGEDEEVIEGSPQLDEAALEAAARPAPTANTTHKAAPDPILDDRPSGDADEDEAAPRVFFRHTTEAPQNAESEPSETIDMARVSDQPSASQASSPEGRATEATPPLGDDAAQDTRAETPGAAAPEDTAEDDEPELAFVPEAEDVAEPAPPAPTIPPTPDVPDTDPADDDPRHDQGPGIAARLVRRGIAPNADRDVLESAASRLKALLDRAS